MREWLWKITSAASLILFVCGLLQSHHETNLIKRAEKTEKHLEKRIFEKEEANDEEDVFTQLRDINPELELHEIEGHYEAAGRDRFFADYDFVLGFIAAHCPNATVKG